MLAGNNNLKNNKMKKVELVTGVHTTDDYPYGRMRCTRRSWIEFKIGKGFRCARQTINPKTGRENNPKRSTYSDFMTLYIEEGTGHCNTATINIMGFKDIDKLINFLSINPMEFTEEQSQDIWGKVIACIRTGIKFTRFPKRDESEKPIAIEALEDMRVEEMIKAYGRKESINYLAQNWAGNIAEIVERYSDENGEAAMSYRITTNRNRE